MAFSPDGRWALTASGDRTARVWDAASGELVGEFDGHAAALLDAQFSADGARVVTSSRDGTAEVQPCDVCGGVDHLLTAVPRHVSAGRSLSDEERATYVH